MLLQLFDASLTYPYPMLRFFFVNLILIANRTLLEFLILGHHSPSHNHSRAHACTEHCFLLIIRTCHLLEADTQLGGDVFTVYDACRYCSIARGEGAALLLQPSPAALAIFEILGRCVKVESEEKFRYLACVAWIFSYREGTHMIHMMII